MRDIDEPIPSDEMLYREIDASNVDGDLVLATAVDLQGTSVHRHKYATPDTIMLSPPRTGLASVMCGDLPKAITCGEKSEFFAVDAPTEGIAHAEIRPGRAPTPESPLGDRPDGKKPSGKSVKNKLRNELARGTASPRARTSGR